LLGVQPKTPHHRREAIGSSVRQQFGHAVRGFAAAPPSAVRATLADLQQSARYNLFHATKRGDQQQKNIILELSF
jgi:hypothetical protein